jgi:AbiV family abortive infection protein
MPEAPTLPADHPLKADEEIIHNAIRLLGDVKLLADHERWPSAVALASLAAEEIGKVIVRRWEQDGDKLPRRGSRHVQKQAAAAHLLLARATIHEVARMGGARKIEADDALLAELVTTLLSWNEAHVARYTELGVIEKLKQLAFYRDLDATEQYDVNGICAEDVWRLVKQARDALEVLGDLQAIKTAKASYLATLSGCKKPLKW